MQRDEYTASSRNILPIQAYTLSPGVQWNLGGQASLLRIEYPRLHRRERKEVEFIMCELDMSFG